jgi:cysteine desulfurase
MIYFDYSSTTPIDQRVLDVFLMSVKKYIANSNAKHKEGIKAYRAISDAISNISTFLNLDDDHEIVFTSGASEANNLIIKGIAFKSNASKVIITTQFEHPSIIAPLNQLARQGFHIKFVKYNEQGTVDLNDLKKLLKKKPLLITVGSVNSEIGIIQPINQIASLVKDISPNTLFHSDVTQSIGKHSIDLNVVDFASCSAHKFYGPNGIGMLIKRKNISLDPLISGGSSISSYRSGTPPTALIIALEKAVELAVTHLQDKFKMVSELNEYARSQLNKINNIAINSFSEALPHILNVSIINKKSQKIVSFLSKQEIYLSAHTACQSDKTYSPAILALTNDKKRAESSIRISLSHLTTKKEIDSLIESIKSI